MPEALWIVGGVLLIVLIWVIVGYNRFVQVRQHLRESWAGIDIELKRRYELIPNLVATVKGFAAHEREVLERVTQLRDAAVREQGSAAAQAATETQLQLGMKQLWAVVEGYPELKSDRHFLELQEQLALTEDRIAATRRFYNGNVRELKQLREMFPSSILANMFSVEDASYFEITDAAERVVPRVG